MLLVAVANLVFAIVALTVGARLLLLARRTRRASELLLGVGLLGMGLGMTLLGLSGVGRVPVSGVSPLALAAGFTLLWVAITGLLAFTWKAFRPDAGWACGIVLTGSALELAICAGAVRAILTGDPEMASNLAGGLWLVAMRLPPAAGFLWGSVESILQYRMGRRRMAIGLGDAVVANRFLLWSVVTLLTTTTNATSAWLQALGQGPFSSPLAAAVMGFGGGLSAALMVLVFMPPQAYLARIRRSAPAASAA